MSSLELRLARYEPALGAPRDPKRRGTYSAALQQFGELLKAAEVVSYLSRPLPLFYALSQAGRAISAARGVGNWEIEGHGLTLPTSSGGQWKERTLRLNPRRRKSLKGYESEVDAFSVVSSALASPKPLTAITYEAIFASIPELSRFDLLTVPVALQFYPDETISNALVVMTSTVRAVVAVPSRIIVQQYHTDLRAAAAKLLSHYPTAAGWQLPSLPSEERGYHPLGLTWEAGAGSSQFYREQRMDEIAPRYSPEDRRYLLPSLGGSAQPVATLMSWWLLLFGLSMQARYEPAEWAALMDVDISEWAAPLEHALDLALTVLPQLVVEGVSGRRV